jgi:hypothetical protein
MFLLLIVVAKEAEKLEEEKTKWFVFYGTHCIIL